MIFLCLIFYYTFTTLTGSYDWLLFSRTFVPSFMSAEFQFPICRALTMGCRVTAEYY